jgi:threonylcarbamoyladenosine tRNA methylthiotransferase MtaB
MKTVALETVGCRLNQYETEKIASQLIEAGMKRVSYKDRADLYILNSCTVTGRADADCRKLINRARRLNANAVVVVTGCYVESQPDQIADLNAADLTAGNDNKDRLSEILQDKFPHLFPSHDIDDSSAPALAESMVNRNGPSGPNRAMVKIGDGCNQNCAYCIVPRVRGNLISIPSADIIGEVNGLIDDGYHEVVLTAVHIGKYEYDGLKLVGLVDKILKETNLSRLRLSSLEPNELDEHLLGLVLNHPRVCRHLHLPLQSGSDRILKMMRRPYSREEYLFLINNIKRSAPDVTIGCDLIVGFPGETDEDFRQSLDILDSGYLDYGHVFSYSDRPGTAASELPDKIGPAIIKERNQIAREIGERNRLRQMERQIGKILGVISARIPNSDDGYYGVSDNYLKVQLPSSAAGGRKIIKFRPLKLIGNYLEGEVIQP